MGAVIVVVALALASVPDGLGPAALVSILTVILLEIELTFFRYKSTLSTSAVESRVKL